MELVIRKKLNQKNLNDAFQLNLSELLQDLIWKIESLFVQICVVLRSLDKLTDTKKVTTFRPGFHAPSFYPLFWGNITLKPSQPFVVKNFQWP